MKLQGFRQLDAQIAEEFIAWRKTANIQNQPKMNLSWSNWGFGREPFAAGIERLAKNNIHFIELHGNHYGNDYGYKAKEVLPILKANGVQVAGICGMVSPESELASKSFVVRQRAVDYFRRELDFCHEVGGSYILFCAGAVGRPLADDENDYIRAVETAKIIADGFVSSGIRGAIEPVRQDEVSIVHTFAQAKQMIEDIDSPGIRHIAGDVFHMLLGEKHIGRTILDYPGLLTNLHLADTHRRALGTGMLDVDIVLMALYMTGYNNSKCFCTPEPLGGGADPYLQMHGFPPVEMLDELVSKTASCFYEREQVILTASDSEIRQAYGL